MGHPSPQILHGSYDPLLKGPTPSLSNTWPPHKNPLKHSLPPPPPPSNGGSSSHCPLKVLLLMEKTHERETHDFMNVESFSQLPFIRPAPVNKEKGIKLFGIEFGTEGRGASQGHSGNEREYGDDAETGVAEEASKDGESNGESGRRFECHYCCRNFPTSQALGGHQNAHKRERQHAKRAHLQSAMAHGGLPDTRVYGFMNYRLGSATAMTYPTWSNNSNTAISSSNTRFYGGHGSLSHQQPINGSPLALWRIPAGSSGFSRDHHSAHPSPLLAGDEMMKRSPGGGNSANPQSRYVCDEKASMQDHVSLDLHL